MTEIKEKVRREVERRSSVDRRKRDVGPPRGAMDRRRTPDRRLPDVEETLFSAEEWDRLFGRVFKRA